MRMRIVTYQSQLQLPTLIVAPVLLVAAVVVGIILVALILISINFLLVVVVLDTLCMLSASFGGANSQLPTAPVEYKLKYFAIRRYVRTRLNLAKD